MRPAFGIALGLVGVGMGCWGAAILPPAISDTVGYAGAHRCAEQPATGCWFEVPATVDETHIEYHYRYSNWVVTLSDRYGSHSLNVWHRSAFTELSPGAAVAARYWNGRPIQIRLPDGSTLPGDDGPGSGLLVPLLAALMFLPGGAFYIYASVRLGQERGWWQPAPKEVYDDLLIGAFAHVPGHRWLGLTLLAGVAGFLVWRWFGIDVWPALAVGTAVMVALAVAGHLRHQSHRRQVARPGG